MGKKLVLTLLIILLAYLFLGFLFTVFRSNSHYNYFIVEEDIIEKNGKSYWQNRCIESNRNNPIPLAQWCVDDSGNFKTGKPERTEWYFHMYSKRLSDWFMVLFGWPLHLLGIDLINFRSAGNVI